VGTNDHPHGSGGDVREGWGTSNPTEPPPGGREKPWYRRAWGIALIAFFALGIVGSLVDGGANDAPDEVAVAQAATGSEPASEVTEDEPDAEASDRQRELDEAQRRIEDLEKELEAAREAARPEPEPESTQEPEPVPTQEPEPEPTAEPAAEPAAPASPTAGQANARRSAQSYLSLMPFSRSGLIEQLEFEGYSTGDATFGVDALDADWKAQAAKAAKSYLDMMPFSRSGLIEQLQFEGYSREQAEHGVTQAGL
jgi:outer membrane biosynthesis protein TonB